jgi:two-component system nitrogen regulation response regulator GlnG
MPVAREKSILVIDDEESICLAFRRFFERRSWTVHIAASCAKGLAAYEQFRPDVVFLDVRLPDGSGLDVLEKLRAADPKARVVVITAYGSLDVVVRAVRGKAFEYLVKPLDLDKASQIADRAVESLTPQGPQAQLAAAPPPDGRTQIVGISPAMQEVYKHIALIADSDAGVLILGETGTGKDLVAKAIHEHSIRKDKPFIAVNCGALPENLVEGELFGHTRGAFTGADSDQPGRFERADGGTFFLDEIGELPPAAQVKLLRVLDTQTVERLGSTKPIHLDVRIIAATNRDLAEDVKAGRFRADLYYRLAVVQIKLPPLSQRAQDIGPLARHFLAAMTPAGSPVPQLSAEAAKALQEYNWPGNVRELRNAIEHAAAVAGAGAILLEHLPESLRHGAQASEARRAGMPDLLRPGQVAASLRDYIASFSGQTSDLYRKAIEPVEKALIEHALELCHGNQSQAADMLGLHRNTLRNKLRELNIDAEGGTGEAQ